MGQFHKGILWQRAKILGLGVPMLLTLACTTQASDAARQDDINAVNDTIPTEILRHDGLGNATAIAQQSNATLANFQLQTVPPAGIESLDEPAFNYFRNMGPLEHAVRLTGVPDYPVWRIRLRLYPEDTGQPHGFRYRVKVDHYNLSPAFYQELAAAYGAENTDPSLNDQSPHRHLELDFRPIMGTAADFLTDSLTVAQSPVTDNPNDCGGELAIACADPVTLWEDDHWINERLAYPEPAPWEDSLNLAPAIVRSLAEQAGKLLDNQWIDGEIPEGVGGDRPWIEVLIDQPVGNAGGVQALWLERFADDSVRAKGYLLFGTKDFTVLESYLCGRGDVAGEFREICP